MSLQDDLIALDHLRKEMDNYNELQHQLWQRLYTYRVRLEALRTVTTDNETTLATASALETFSAVTESMIESQIQAFNTTTDAIQNLDESMSDE